MDHEEMDLHRPIRMQIPVPHILPHADEEALNLHRRPSQHIRKQHQTQRLQPSLNVEARPGA